MTFGELVKQKRLNKGYGLREFCIAIEYDCSNWSKVERSISKPPIHILDKIIKVLELTKSEAGELEDAAYIDQNLIPRALRMEEVIKRLPIFCKAARDNPEKFLELIYKSYIDEDILQDDRVREEIRRVIELFTKPAEVLKPLEDLYRKEHPSDKFYVPDTTLFYTWIVEKIMGGNNG
jgi:transcriptional regulator with XRE-family HTH domain